jgi:polyisoprenoid-binding protein YceI
MRPYILAASLVLAACATAPAQTQAPAASSAQQAPVAPALPKLADVSLDPADAPAGAYNLDPRHASVIWRVRHTGLGIYVARFDRVAGVLDFDPANPENSKLDVTIEARSVSTGLRNAAGVLSFDDEIAEVLGAGANPQISFKSTSVARTGPAAGLVTGDLTLNGQTHPAALEVSFEGGRFVQLRGKHVLAFSARTVIDRTQWGVESLIFNRFAGDEVEILIEGEFVKA